MPDKAGRKIAVGSGGAKARRAVTNRKLQPARPQPAWRSLSSPPAVRRSPLAGADGPLQAGGGGAALPFPFVTARVMIYQDAHLLSVAITAYMIGRMAQGFSLCARFSHSACKCSPEGTPGERPARPCSGYVLARGRFRKARATTGLLQQDETRWPRRPAAGGQQDCGGGSPFTTPEAPGTSGNASQARSAIWDDRRPVCAAPARGAYGRRKAPPKPPAQAKQLRSNDGSTSK